VTGVRVRVRNASATDFESVRVTLPEDGEHDLGRVPAAGRSAFVAATRAYRYAGFRVRVEGRDLLLQPIDYVGERPLAPGDYDYVLDVDDGRLTIDLARVN
jgi:hypothetical protein